MTSLTPIPEWQSYTVAVVVVCASASASLAAHIVRSSGAPAIGRRFLATHSLLMAGLLVLAVAVIGLPPILPRTLPALLGWTLLGLAVGYLALLGDRLVLQHSGAGLAPAGSIRRSGGATHVVPLLLGVVAALEEVHFRGYLVMFAFRLPGAALIAAALALSVLCFAASHIYAGLPEAIAKLPLGALALVASLLSGAVWPAVIAHVYFNLLATPPSTAA